MTDRVMLDPHTPEWHARRRLGVGSSDAPAIMGLSPWATPYRIWAEKVGEPVEISDEEQEWLRWGRLIEPIIIAEYARRTGHELSYPQFLKHPQHEWIFSNPDAWTENWIAVEAKMARTREGWGEPGTDEIPEPYLVQCHHHMLAGAVAVEVPVLFTGQKMEIYRVEPDAAIHKELICAESLFWQKVRDREPPDPVSLADAQARWGRMRSSGDVEATGKAIAAWTMACEAQEKIRLYQGLLEGSKLVLVSALADRGDTLIGIDGKPICTWKLDKGTKGYTVEPRPPGRKMLIKERKE